MKWDEISNNDGVNSSYEKFIEMFKNIYEVSFPVRTISRMCEKITSIFVFFSAEAKLT